MQMYSIRYENIQRRFEASSHLTARILGTRWLASRFGAVDPDKVIVVDVDAAGHGRHTGHCQGCSPYEMCSRSGTCGWCDERFDDRYDGLYGVERDFIERHDALHAYHETDTATKKAAARRAMRIWNAKRPGEAWEAALADDKCAACNVEPELCMPINQVGESVWARVQQEELDKVHAIWSRRSGDKQ